jgi:hypothetical protein
MFRSVHSILMLPAMELIFLNSGKVKMKAEIIFF